MLDALENREFKLRFNAKSIKDDLENICNEGVRICEGKFIGPIKNGAINKNEEVLFFISFAKQS